MLGKMLIHGLAAAALIGSAAYAYAETRSNAPFPAQAAQQQQVTPGQTGDAVATQARDNGYLTAPRQDRKELERAKKHEKRHDKRHRDDDDGDDD